MPVKNCPRPPPPLAPPPPPPFPVAPLPPRPPPATSHDVPVTAGPAATHCVPPEEPVHAEEGSPIIEALRQSLSFLGINDAVRCRGSIKALWVGTPTNVSYLSVSRYFLSANLATRLTRSGTVAGPSVETISFSGKPTSPRKDVTSETLRHLLAAFPRITCIDAANCICLESIPLDNLWSKGLHLRKIDLTSGKNFTDEALVTLALQCPQLREIRLSICHQISDVSFAVLVQNCRKIRVLHLPTYVTDACLLKHAAAMKSLELLFLVYCKNVKMQSTIDTFKAAGVKISIWLPSPLK